MGTDPIDELVARASRVKEGAFADVRVDARARDALAELFTLGRGDAAALPAATPSRRRMRRGVVAGIIAAVLTATTAAATGWISARTGVEAGGGENGTGEMIRLDGSDLGEVIDRLSRGIPLPPGGSFDQWEKKLDPGQTSTSGLENAIAFVASCQWTTYWLDAFQRGDTAAMAQAQIVLDEIPAWPQFATGGITKLLEQRAEGARQGDPALFQQDYDINCAHTRSPVGPGGG